MDYKQFVNSTIYRLDQPSFDAVKKALVGEYLSFSFINEDDITREILSEKVVDYFEKLGIKFGQSLDKAFDKQIEHYLKSWDSIVAANVSYPPKGKKVRTYEDKTRAMKYYEKADSIKRLKTLTVNNMIDYSRIMMCLFWGIVQNGNKPIENFDYAIDVLNPEEIVSAIKSYKIGFGPLKSNWFILGEQYSQDTCFFILVIIMLYTIINDKVVGEFGNE